jgi:hypothetical protein
VNKKKQKNFMTLARGHGNAVATAPAPGLKKFLRAFFKKHCLPSTLRLFDFSPKIAIKISIIGIFLLMNSMRYLRRRESRFAPSLPDSLNLT